MQLVARKPSEAAPARMQPLATLPVFFNLKGKRVVIVGGSAAAAWKLELIAAAGARIDIYAPHAETEMAAALERLGSKPGLKLHTRPWAVDIFNGAVMALADIEGDAEARAFACAARVAGVPVNIIDKPAFCQFQFGSIVNRSPVVVGISTDGAAPVFAQAIRSRIETLLPPAVAAWGRLARDVRSTVMARLAKGSPRRLFWERFSQLAFGAPPDAAVAGNLDRLIDVVAGERAATAGRVTLVGAGPGDAEFLTLKAVRALQAADVILFDDLVSEDVLELARREAKRMLVGKRGRRESCAQEDINDLMVKLASQGKYVVRLKSGDPMIFGRAGEEIAELEAAGVTVDVVPGITAGLAMAASLGLSLTHRDAAQSVRFVTGHSRKGELPETLDWQGLADPSTTLVFYMGGRTAMPLANRLIAAGLSAATPAVVMTSISRQAETRWCGSLAKIAEGESGSAQDGPILIGIGQAFAAAQMRSGQIPRAAPASGGAGSEVALSYVAAGKRAAG